MDRIHILGGERLEGEVLIGGAKNAALPLMASSLLSSSPLTLSNLPHLVDITTMVQLLGDLGVKISMDGDSPNGGYAGRAIRMDASEPLEKSAPYDLVRKMRASVLVLGPLLARWGEARVSMPGGCAIGTRPIDLHLSALEALGATIDLKGGYVNATAPNGLKGCEINFPFVSVGATENILMASTLAKGKTIIKNAAREPEIIDLANCLADMGASINGAGTDTIEVVGTEELNGTDYQIIPDRIETGTYAIASAITGGDLLLRGARFDTLSAFFSLLGKAGVEVIQENEGVRIKRTTEPLAAVDICTEPYPGFPTDMQAQIMALMAVAKGKSIITESIFENRFMHVPELCRMGADIVVNGSSATVNGVSKLSGAELMATDLRASVSLILAGLVARGETIINRVYHLDRGYERIEEKLSMCGANIKRVSF